MIRYCGSTGLLLQIFFSQVPFCPVFTGAICPVIYLIFIYISSRCHLPGIPVMCFITCIHYQINTALRDHHSEALMHNFIPLGFNSPKTCHYRLNIPHSAYACAILPCYIWCQLPCLKLHYASKVPQMLDVLSLRNSGKQGLSPKYLLVIPTIWKMSPAELPFFRHAPLLHL